MTYCVGLKLNKGLIFMTDTRTNAGMDNISVFRKMITWQKPNERVLTLLCAGNLATTQATISLLDERSKAPEERNPSLLEATSMFQAAQTIGNTLKEVISKNAEHGQRADSSFNATLILGGQIGKMPPRLFLIYPEGNFIEASDDTPFFQIGETKYGKPILVRAFDQNMSFEDAVGLLLVSFDSTIKSNLSVGAPLDLQIYETNKLKISREIRISEGHPHYRAISDNWSAALRTAFYQLPKFKFK